MLNLNLIKCQEIVKKYKLLSNASYSKSKGQNFIFDDILLEKIVSFARIPVNSQCLEIGPGPGGLTKEILKKEPKKLICIDTDIMIINCLKDVFKNFKNLEVMHSNALDTSLNQLFKQQKFHIISNLPYNIGCVLLTNWLNEIHLVHDMTLMFQKEVAERIIANTGTKKYGRLSILCQILCNIEYGFDVEKEYFTPQPKVDSAVIKLTPKPHSVSLVHLIPMIEKITHHLFQNRRKQINNGFKTLFPNNHEEVLASVHLKPTQRPEEIPAHVFLELAQRLHS